MRPLKLTSATKSPILLQRLGLNNGIAGSVNIGVAVGTPGRKDDARGRRAAGGIGNRLATEILDRLDWRILLHVTVKIGCARGLGPDDPNRCALGKGA